MARKKNPKAPEVLWRLFHKRVNSLASTIISITSRPPQPPKCRCRGRRCLACVSPNNVMPFLLRPKDSSHYRELLTNSFLVLLENDTYYQNYDYTSRWNQLQIVRRTIKTLMEQCSANLICAGYDKETLNSDIVQLLTSSAWRVLLKRVGDSLMIYLLENTLIFLPLARGQYLQVSGLSVRNLCFAVKNRKSNSNENFSFNHHGFDKKLKRTNEVDTDPTEQQASSPLESSLLLNSSTCTGCSRKQYTAQVNGQSSKEFLQSPTEFNIASAAAENADNEKNLPCDQHSSNGTVGSPKRRPRQWRWQRKKNLNSRMLSLGPCREGALYKFQALQACSCCSAFQYLPNVNDEDLLERQTMLYKMGHCSSAFPRTRILISEAYILNSSKPDFEGANALLNDIFGNCWPSIASGASHCSHSSNVCQIKSKCLYHSLTKLLKTLIHNAKYIQLSRLLDKHCAVPSFEKDPDESAYTTEGSCSGGNHACKKRRILCKDKVKLEKKIEGDCDSDVQSSNQSMPFKAQYGPANLYSSHKQVTAFTWAVCRNIVPRDLLGDPSNWKKLRMNISRFIRLRRFENFSLKQCMHELKISKFPLLYNKHSSCDLSAVMVRHSGGCEANGGDSGGSVEYDKVDGTYFVKHKILKCWIYWLFSSFVVPLLQANFYVTESEGGRQELFYYRKSVWEKVISETVTFLETQNFHHLNDASLRTIVRNRSFGYSRARLCPKGSGVRVLANLKAPSKIPVSLLSSKVVRNRSFGYSGARLCPKGSGVRVLANLGAPSKIPVSLLSSKVQHRRRSTSALRFKKTEYQEFKSINSLLRSIHVILKGVQMKLPESLGSSAFDYNDVYKRLVPFISLLRNGCTTRPKIFIVVADVSRAFDTVNHNKLLDVIKTVLLEDEYMLNKSDKIICTKTSFYVQQLLLLSPQDGHSQPGILVNQGLSTRIKKETIVSDLVEHIKHNILQLGDEFYLQSIGIPQGSIISSLLCSFYYGHMEKHVIYPYLEKECYSHAIEDLGELHTDNSSTSGGNSTDNVDLRNPEYLLLRFIDDYLFISTSEHQALKFFSLLQRGFCDYNAFMNEKKFGSNFHVNHKSEHEANRVFVGQDGISFLKWSGLLINSCTLEIQADYSRYQDLHLRSTLTVSWKGETYRKLRVKLCYYLRPKCHPIFYDANINSPSVVRLNIYQVFLLSGMKFHSYVSVLFNLPRLDIKSILGCLEFSLRHMYKLIKKRNHSLFCATSLQPAFEVEKREIEWLGLFAYIRVLKRKQSRYGSLLFLLESKLKGLPINENLSPALKYATDDAHSSAFWKIKY